MKWSRQRKQKEKRQSCSSSAGFSSSFFKLLPISWISKFRQTKNSKTSARPPDNHLTSPEFRPFSSDHLFVSPAIFDRLAAGDDAPRRHSCATADEVRFFDRSRARDNMLASARFDPDFPLLTCRSCRRDPFSPPEKKDDLRCVSSPPAPASIEKTKIRRSRGKSLESFAVVKRSIDPQRDFRESMVEMIENNRMGKAEELERLLACYLALNAEEYHGVIVKVFRQVWLDLDPKIVHGRRRREGP